MFVSRAGQVEDWGEHEFSALPFQGEWLHLPDIGPDGRRSSLGGRHFAALLRVSDVRKIKPARGEGWRSLFRFFDGPAHALHLDWVAMG